MKSRLYVLMCMFVLLLHVLASAQQVCDEFDSSSINTSIWNPVSGTWTQQNGQVTGYWPLSDAHGEQGNLVLTDAVQPTGDYTFEADMVNPSSNGVGSPKIILYNSVGNKYNINYDAWNRLVSTQVKQNGSMYQSLASLGYEVSNIDYFNTDPEAINNAKVVKHDGNLFTVYLNGHVLFTIVESIWYGDVNIGLGAYGSQSYERACITTGGQPPNHGNLGLLVNNSASLDAEEQAAYNFATSCGFTVTKIDPSTILANPAILDSVKGFWAPNASEPAGFNDPTIISALQGEIQNGKRILLDWYGFYLGQYLGLGNAYIGSPWYPVVSDHIYWVDKKTDHPVFQNMSPWIPPSGPPDDETKLIKYVDPGYVPGGPSFDVTAPFDTLRYVYLWASYGWPGQSPDPDLCAEYGITCTNERSLALADFAEIHDGCGSAILQHAFLPTMTALDHWHFGQAGYKLLENILSYVCSGYLLGDANGDGNINVSDVVYLINYLFIGGPAPDPIARGDVNRDNFVNVTDVVYLINYLFIGGPSPCEGKLLSSSESSTSLSKSAGIARIGFSEAKGAKDSQLEISIVGDFNVNVSGLQLEINYDPRDVTLLEPSLTSRTQGLQLYSSTKDGIQKIGILDINGRNHILPGQGPLVTLSAKGSDLSNLVIKEAVLVDRDAHTIPVEIVKTIGTTEDNSVPQNFSLAQNYPNPFNPSTSVQFTVASGQSSVPTTLKIYNVRGQLVRTLVDQPKISGTYEVIWDSKDDRGEEVSSGVYLYKLKVGDYSETKKMILMK